MRINEDLKLVLPIQTDEDGKVLLYAYHTPISKEVFEANYRILAATKADLISKGIHYQMGTGPRIASLTLQDAARKEAVLQGDLEPDEKTPKITAAIALFEELKRLTLVRGPSESGWNLVPVDVAIKNESLDPEEWKEAESSLVFFTCHCSMAKKAERRKISISTASWLGGSSTSLSATEYADSLQISTQGEDSEPTPSSVPS